MSAVKKYEPALALALSCTGGEDGGSGCALFLITTGVTPAMMDFFCCM